MGNHLDLDPGAVHNAGCNTAATSSHWSEWAARVDTELRNAAVDAHEPVVTTAFEEHLSQWNPRMKGMATNADALGTNAASGSNVLVNADGSATTVLAGQATTEHNVTTRLHRPIAL